MGRRGNGEGSIYVKQRDKNGKAIKYCAQYSDKDGKPRYIYAPTKTEASKKLKEALRAKDDGITLQNKNIKLADWAAEWLDVYIKPHIKVKTYVSYDCIVKKHIIDSFPNVQLKDVTENMLQKHINSLLEDTKTRSEYKIGTVKAVKKLLFSCLEKAADIGLINKNPAKNLRTPLRRTEEKKILTIDEQKQFEKLLRAEMEYDYTYGAYLLILFTGVRPGEALSIQIDDIDFEKREIKIERTMTLVKSKSGLNVKGTGTTKTLTSDRVIPITETACNLIRHCIEGREERIKKSNAAWGEKPQHDPKWVQDGYLFISQQGNAISVNYFSEKLMRFSARYAIEYVTPHGFRHTFATRWVEKGLNIKTLSKVLGHANTNMTLNIYTHSLPDEERANMDKFDL